MTNETDANAAVTGRPRQRTGDGMAMPIAAELHRGTSAADAVNTTPVGEGRPIEEDDGFAPINFGFLNSLSHVTLPTVTTDG